MQPFFRKRVHIGDAGADMDFSGYEEMPDIFFKETLKECCHSIGMPMATDKSVSHLTSEIRKQRIGAVNVRKNALGYLENSRLGLFNAELIEPQFSHTDLREVEPLQLGQEYILGPWKLTLSELEHSSKPRVLSDDGKLASERVSVWDIVHGVIEYTLPSDSEIKLYDSPRIPPLTDVPQFLRCCVPWVVCALDEFIEGSGSIGADPKLRTRNWMWYPSASRPCVRVTLSFFRQHFRNLPQQEEQQVQGTTSPC